MTNRSVALLGFLALVALFLFPIDCQHPSSPTPTPTPTQSQHASHFGVLDDEEFNAVFIDPWIDRGLPDKVIEASELKSLVADSYTDGTPPSDTEAREKWATEINVPALIKRGMIRETESIPYSNAYKVNQTLYRGSSKFQEISVVSTNKFGNIMTIDRDLMLTEKDEFHYHEMMANVPLAYIKGDARVVVIGGGDGGTLREVLRHPNVVNATMIDIDKKVIDTAKRFFPTTSASFFHPRGTTFFKDGAQWAVDRCKDPSFAKVDVIIIDSTDFSAAVPLFQASFYQSMKDCVLRPGGILIHNLDSLCWDIETVRMRSERMKGIFKHVHIYQVFQPTYSGGHYAINFASDEVEPFRTPIDWEAFDAKKLRLQYYNPDIHYASFAFPGFVMTQNLGVHANKLQDIVSLPPRRLSPVEQYYERVDVFEAIRESRRNGTAKSNTVDKN